MSSSPKRQCSAAITTCMKRIARCCSGNPWVLDGIEESPQRLMVPRARGRFVTGVCGDAMFFLHTTYSTVEFWVDNVLRWTFFSPSPCHISVVVPQMFNDAGAARVVVLTSWAIVGLDVTAAGFTRVWSLPGNFSDASRVVTGASDDTHVVFAFVPIHNRIARAYHVVILRLDGVPTTFLFRRVDSYHDFWNLTVALATEDHLDPPRRAHPAARKHVLISGHYTHHLHVRDTYFAVLQVDDGAPVPDDVATPYRQLYHHRTEVVVGLGDNTLAVHDVAKCRISGSGGSGGGGGGGDRRLALTDTETTYDLACTSNAVAVYIKHMGVVDVFYQFRVMRVTWLCVVTSHQKSA